MDSCYGMTITELKLLGIDLVEFITQYYQAANLSSVRFSLTLLSQPSDFSTKGAFYTHVK